MKERDTLETTFSAVVVVVSGSDRLREAAARAAQRVPTAQVKHCALENAATTVATCWPFAIIVGEDVYAFDPQEFEALARDVAAVLIRVREDGKPAGALALNLQPQLLQALRQRYR